LVKYLGKLEAAGTVGTPKIGGPLQLFDQNGNPFNSNDIKDKFMLVYFGFTHCPDICPEELDRMGKIIEIIGTCSRTF
jgi:protein SCO1/2